MGGGGGAPIGSRAIAIGSLIGIAIEVFTVDVALSAMAIIGMAPPPPP
jgi:hypothetical protein